MSTVTLITLTQEDKAMDGDKLHFTKENGAPKATLQIKNVS